MWAERPRSTASPPEPGMAGAPGQSCGTGSDLKQTRTLWGEAMAPPRLQPSWISRLVARSGQPWSEDPAWRLSAELQLHPGSSLSPSTDLLQLLL